MAKVGAAFYHRFLSFLFCIAAECILLAKAQGQNNGTATGGTWLSMLPPSPPLRLHTPHYLPPVLPSSLSVIVPWHTMPAAICSRIMDILAVPLCPRLQHNERGCGLSPFRQWQLAKIALLSGSWSAAVPSLSHPIFTLYDCHNFGYFSRHSIRLLLCGYQWELLPLQPRIVLHCLHCSNLWSRRPVLVLSCPGPVLVHFHLRVKVLRLKYANVARAKRDLFAMQTGD